MKKKILIADDSIDLSEAMSEILEMKGYESIVSHNGIDTVAKTLTEHPDLILLDIRMPDIDGFEVIRRLRNESWGKTVKILVLTASADPTDIPLDVDLDVKDFLLKTDWGIHNISKKIEEKLAE